MAVRVLMGDWVEQMRTLEDASVQMVGPSSPPYLQLRDYGVPGQVGQEASPDEFVRVLVDGFREARRVLRDDGILVINLGITYAGSGRGPTGHNGIGNQAKRQGFVGGAATSDRSRSRERGRAPACDSDGRARSDSRRLDFAYSDLCGGCQADLRIHHGRSADTSLPHQLDASLLSPTDRDNGLPGSVPASPDASIRDAQESTTPESSRPRLGECSRCATCGLCLGVSQTPVAETQEIRSGLHAASETTDCKTGNASRDDRPAHCSRCTDRACGCCTAPDPPKVQYQYTTFKPKDLIPTPFMVAMALQADGWWLRSIIPWVKRNAMPSSVRDRPSDAVEYLFLLSKSARYYWDGEAIRQPNTAATIARHSGPAEAPNACAYSMGLQGHPRRHEGTLNVNGGGANGRAFRNSDPFFNTWQGLWCDEDGDPLALIVNPQPFSGSHFATFPPRLVEPFVKAGSRPGDTILDPFGGAGTVGLVASRLDRNAVLCELNPEYAEMARRRIDADAGALFGEPVTVEAPVQAALFDEATS